jgi:hypothetical protein
MGPFTEVEYENVGWIQMAGSRYSRHLGFRECGGQSSGSTKMQEIYLPLTSVLRPFSEIVEFEISFTAS